MRFVESRRWTSVIVAVLIGAVGGSVVGFTTTPRQRADAEVRAPTTTAAPRQRSSHAVVTLPPTSQFRPVATPWTSRAARTSTTEAPTTTARPKRTTTTTTGTTTSSTDSTTSTTETTTSSTDSTTSTTETTTSSTDTTTDTSLPDSSDSGP